jgi:hypothetical protein
MIKKIYLVTIGFLLALSSFAQKDAAKTYKMVVSFSSIGTGVPGSQPIKDYIREFKKANKIDSITADRIGPLGREGEYKLAFTLKELCKKQQRSFIKGIRKVTAKMTGRGNAGVTENETFTPENVSSRTSVVTQKF